MNPHSHEHVKGKTAPTRERDPLVAPFSSLPHDGDIKFPQNWKHPLIAEFDTLGALDPRHNPSAVLAWLAESTRIQERWIKAGDAHNYFGITMRDDRIHIVNPVDKVLTPVADVLENVRKYPPEGFSYSKLDRYSAHDPIAALCLRSIFQSLTPGYVAQQVGLPALLWTSAYADHPHKRLPAFQHLGTLWERLQPEGSRKISSREMLHKAMSAVSMWVDKKSERRVETVLCNYGVFRYLLEHEDQMTLRMPFGVDLNRNILHSGRYVDDKFSSRNADSYSIRICWPANSLSRGDEAGGRAVTAEDGSNRLVRYQIFLDSFVGLALCSRGIPQAVVSLLATDPNTLSIVQVQGVQGRFLNASGEETDERKKSRALMGLNYTRLMFDLVTHLAYTCNFQRVGLLGASNNPALGSERNPERTFMWSHGDYHYNQAATACGFEYDPRTQNLFKESGPIFT